MLGICKLIEEADQALSVSLSRKCVSYCEIKGVSTYARNLSAHEISPPSPPLSSPCQELKILVGAPRSRHEVDPLRRHCARPSLTGQLRGLFKKALEDFCRVPRINQ